MCLWACPRGRAGDDHLARLRLCLIRNKRADEDGFDRDQPTQAFEQMDISSPLIVSTMVGSIIQYSMNCSLVMAPVFLRSIFL